jgi:hypothetical protein
LYLFFSLTAIAFISLAALNASFSAVVSGVGTIFVPDLTVPAMHYSPAEDVCRQRDAKLLAIPTNATMDAVKAAISTSAGTLGSQNPQITDNSRHVDIKEWRTNEDQSI